MLSKWGRTWRTDKAYWFKLKDGPALVSLHGACVAAVGENQMHMNSKSKDLARNEKKVAESPRRIGNQTDFRCTEFSISSCFQFSRKFSSICPVSATKGDRTAYVPQRDERKYYGRSDACERKPLCTYHKAGSNVQKQLAIPVHDRVFMALTAWHTRNSASPFPTTLSHTFTRLHSLSSSPACSRSASVTIGVRN